MKNRSVYIVDGSRSPFLKATGKNGTFSASELAVQIIKPLLARQPFSVEDLDEVVTGCVNPAPDEMNISRVIALRAGCGEKMPAYTVQRNCASGLQSIDSAFNSIALGKEELVLAGGTEAMSQAPILYSKEMANWFGRLYMSKGFFPRFAQLLKFRPRFLKPVFGLQCGLTDPVCGLSMGQTAENLAWKLSITREEMDEYALQSQKRAAAARTNGHFKKEIGILYDQKGRFYNDDTGIRENSSLEALGNLKPVFDKKYGQVTAGNSSQITDGSTFLLLASEEAVKKHKLNVLARIVDINWAALNPEIMGLGPVFASTPLLERHDLTLSDIDYWEINEAFAAQVLACLKVWKDRTFSKEYLGLNKSFGQLNLEQLNVDGGAIALGHPVGASGARITLHLLHVLERNKAKRGVATLCVGGGQGGAVLLERV